MPSTGDAPTVAATVRSAVPAFVVADVGATARWYAANLEGQPFVPMALTHQPYGDWEFEVRDPNGYVLVFGGAY